MNVAVQEDWRTLAGCRDSDPERWFAVEGKGAEGLHWNKPAIAICRGCPVRLECAREGLRIGEVHAVMGGFRLWKEGDRRERDAWLESRGVRP